MGRVLQTKLEPVGSCKTSDVEEELEPERSTEENESVETNELGRVETIRLSSPDDGSPSVVSSQLGAENGNNGVEGSCAESGDDSSEPGEGKEREPSAKATEGRRANRLDLRLTSSK